MTDSPAPRRLANAEQLDDVLTAPLALIYKHSTRCPIAAAALQEMRQLLEDRPGAPVWMVDVNTQRTLSREIADQTGVTHESPQAILLSNGDVFYDVSHFEIKADDLARELDAAEEGARGAA